MTITEESFAGEPMEKIPSKIPHYLGDRDGTQEAGVLAMSVQCCAGIICTMAFLRDEKGDRYHREVFLETSYEGCAPAKYGPWWWRCLLAYLSLAQQAPGNRSFSRERVYKPCRCGFLIMGPSWP